jgi:hypothetical protein
VPTLTVRGWQCLSRAWILPGKSEERDFVRTLRRRGGRVSAGPVPLACTPEQ